VLISIDLTATACATLDGTAVSTASEWGNC
jgi:hypothetical protein